MRLSGSSIAPEVLVIRHSNDDLNPPIDYVMEKYANIRLVTRPMGKGMQKQFQNQST